MDRLKENFNWREEKKETTGNSKYSLYLKCNWPTHSGYQKGDLKAYKGRQQWAGPSCYDTYETQQILLQENANKSIIVALKDW